MERPYFKKTFKINKMVTDIKSFYAAGIFSSAKGKLLTVVHRKKRVYKLPGGTSEKQTGALGAYNPHSNIQVKDKLFATCVTVFGADVIQDHRSQVKGIIEKIVSETKDFHALQMVVEFIEEVGMIPTKFRFLQDQETAKDFFQYFYVVEEVYAFSRDRESFVLITKDNLEEMLPENGYDYYCSDRDIEKVELIPILDATSKYNFAYNHKNPLHGYIFLNGLK